MADNVEWGAHFAPVGAFIREQRRLVKLSQRQLAKSTGLSDTYLSQLERGMHEPSLRALRAIAKGLNVSADQLISLTGAIEHELDEDEATDEGEAPLEPRTEVAIRQDGRLSEEQKAALLAVLASYLQANESGRAGAGTTQEAPRPSRSSAAASAGSTDAGSARRRRGTR